MSRDGGQDTRRAIRSWRRNVRADYEDAKYTRIAALLRYCPQGAASSGFFFGGSLGGAEVGA